MSAEGVLLRVDRLVGGRYATHRIPAEMRTEPRTRRALVTVTWWLVAELVLAAAAVGVAVDIHDRGGQVSGIVWYRLVVIFALTATLFYFVWRAGLGFYWAYSRLRLFSIVFPVVALVTSAVPGLYPSWMIVEQVLFSLVLVGVSLVLSSKHMRAAFAKPRRVPAG